MSLFNKKTEEFKEYLKEVTVRIELKRVDTKHCFRLKKIENPIYISRIEIDIIREQKWEVILDILWLAQHDQEIDWKVREVKMTRCLEKYKRQ